MHSFIINEEKLLLLPERAAIWPRHKLLIVADLHLGKVTHFRKAGLPLPRHAELENYERLSSILLNNDLNRVLILGDLFHSVRNSEWDIFTRFLAEFKEINFDMVSGNHDILPEEAYHHSNFLMLGETFEQGPFIFSHKPLDNTNNYNIYGHIHPGIKLKGSARQSLRLPCFHFTKTSAVFPAFGSFTGLHCVSVKKGENVFAISDDSIFQLS